MPFPWQAISTATGKTAGRVDERFAGTAAARAERITWHWKEVLRAEEPNEVRGTMPIIRPRSGAPGTGRQWNFLEGVAQPASGRLVPYSSVPGSWQQTSQGQETSDFATYSEASEELCAQIADYVVIIEGARADYGEIAGVWMCEQPGEDFDIVYTHCISGSSGEPVGKQEHAPFGGMGKPQRKPKLPFLKLLRHQMDEYHFAVPSVFFGGMCGVAACTVFSLGMPVVGFLIGSLCVSVVVAWALATDAKRTSDR